MKQYNAFLNVGLQMINLEIIQSIDDMTIQNKNNKIVQSKISSLQLQLNNLLQLLYKENFIYSKSLVIHFFGNIYPLQIVVSTDCQIDVINLKELQKYLLENNFNIKINL